MNNWSAKVGEITISVSESNLNIFKYSLVPSDNLKRRMSQLFWFDIYVMKYAFGIEPHEILSSVKNLEDGEPHSGIKRAAVFKNKPLKGLWHKHFSCARFLPHNILLGLGKNGLREIIEKTIKEENSMYVTEKMIEVVAKRVSREPIEQRHKEGKLTGEWIIFVKHNNANYYLCLNTHSAGDQFIYDRILEHCTRDFPNLKNWIGSQVI